MLLLVSSQFEQYATCSVNTYYSFSKVCICGIMAHICCILLPRACKLITVPSPNLHVKYLSGVTARYGECLFGYVYRNRAACVVNLEHDILDSSRVERPACELQRMGRQAEATQLLLTGPVWHAVTLAWMMIDQLQTSRSKPCSCATASFATTRPPTLMAVRAQLGKPAATPTAAGVP